MIVSRTLLRSAQCGIFAGIAAGTASGGVALILSIASSEDIWVNAKMAAYPFLGDRALAPGFDLYSTIVSVLSHFAVAIGWATLLTAVLVMLRAHATVALGAMWGLIVWIAMFYGLLPLVGAAKIVHITPLYRAIVEHVLYGIAVALGLCAFCSDR